MKSLVIGYNHPAKDKRVMRTVAALKKLGIVYYQFSGSAMPVEEEDLHYFAIEKQFMQGRFSLQKRRNFDKRILGLIRNTNCDLIYFHGFPSSMPLKVFKFARKMGKKIIYDLHEIMPEQFLPERLSFLNPVLWKVLKTQLSLVDGVISVSEEALRMMLEKTGIDKPKLCLPNYATGGVSFGNCVKNSEIAVVGGTHRKISIDSRLLNEIKRNFKLISIGTTCNIADEELPFMDYELMMERISKVKFTLLAFQSRRDPQYANDIYSLPNKFYDSLAAGTPVIIDKRFVSMKEIVEETQTGIILDLLEEPKDPSLILNALDSYGCFLDNLRANYDRFVWDNSKESAFVDFITAILDS